MRSKKQWTSNPFHTEISKFTGSRCFTRRFPEAEAQFVRLLELNPGHPYILLQLVNICEQQGRDAEAFDYFVQWLTATKADAATVERFKAAYARSGWRGSTLERVKMDMYTSQPFDLACLYASVGDKNKAFESLETAFRNRSYKIAVLEVAPQTRFTSPRPPLPGPRQTDRGKIKTTLY